MCSFFTSINMKNWFCMLKQKHTKNCLVFRESQLFYFVYLFYILEAMLSYSPSTQRPTWKVVSSAISVLVIRVLHFEFINFLLKYCIQKSIRHTYKKVHVLAVCSSMIFHKLNTLLLPWGYILIVQHYWSKFLDCFSHKLNYFSSLSFQ